MATAGCKVLWGDGATSTLVSGTNTCTHTYAAAGDYQIRISGTHTRFYHIGGTPTKVIQAIRLYSKLTSGGSAFYGCYNSAFSILSGFSIGNFVTDTSNMFYNGSFASIPASLVIPASVTNCDGMFKYCFNLTANISGIFPTWAPGKTVNVSRLFAYDTKVTGTIPAAKLWGRTDVTWTKADAFINCTSLTNYTSIPAAWGGGGT